MNKPYELDPNLLVAEINQINAIAEVQNEFDPELQTFKLKSTNVKDLALEVKDFLGRSEYSNIQIHYVLITPDTVAQEGDTYYTIDGKVAYYAEGQLIAGFTLMKAILWLKV
jgi:hypothetical protein